MRKFSIEFVKSCFLDKNIEVLSEKYTGSQAKLYCKCLKCANLFYIRCNDVRNGHGCARCGNVKRKSIEQVKEQYLQINIKVLDDIYINNRTFLNLQCLVCNNFWKSKLCNNFKNLKTNECRKCPKCGLEQKKKTNLQKYGFLSPAKNKEVALKAAKTCSNSCVLFHWKTNEELVCVGSYEKRVVEWLNLHKIEFEWQSKTFETPLISEWGNTLTYRPDLYLSNEDKWVEIKGYFRKDAKEKWDWFHAQYANSELWDKNRLKKVLKEDKYLCH